MPELTKIISWEKSKYYFYGACCWLILSNFYRYVFPDHPAPAAIEADGKTYVACNTPDTGRGWFHSTYYADFKDNNGQTISLRGIEKLIVTNLPQKINAPMPSNPVAVDGKTYREGAEYTWPDGSKARVENGKWAPVKMKNTVCESDDDKEKREARESAAREAEQKKLAEEFEVQQAALRTKTPCPAIITSVTGETQEPNPAAIGRPECEGHLPNRVATPEEEANWKKPDVSRTKIASTPHWATVTNDYGIEIYKRCYFNAGTLPCSLNEPTVASLHKGDRVQVVSAKTRSAGGSEIYEIKFRQWAEWVDAVSLSFDIE